MSARGECVCVRLRECADLTEESGKVRRKERSGLGGVRWPCEKELIKVTFVGDA